MSTNLSASIQKLRESASKLNELTDQANLTVQTVEHLLRDECKIGTAAFIQLDDDSTNRGLTAAFANVSPDLLSYRKVGSNFRIAVVEKGGGAEKVTPWSDCPRDLKLKTLRKLPDLVSKLLSELDKRIHDAEVALADVSDILNIESNHLGKMAKSSGISPKRKRVRLKDIELSNSKRKGD